jgi:hypothetical protein
MTSGRTVSSIRMHELTGTLMTVLDFLDPNALNAAAEEKSRVRAATDFMVVEFVFFNV